jgi:hypothetical protein
VKRPVFEDIRRIALALDNVVECKSYGTTGFKAGGKLFARQHQDGKSLVLATTFEEREALMAEDPETYYITDHYLNYPWVLIGLSRIHPDALGDLMTRAWRIASKPKPRKRAE